MEDKATVISDKGMMLMEEVAHIFGKGVKVSVLIRAPDIPIMLLSNERNLSEIKDYIEYITCPPPSVLH